MRMTVEVRGNAIPKLNELKTKLKAQFPSMVEDLAVTGQEFARRAVDLKGMRFTGQLQNSITINNKSTAAGQEGKVFVLGNQNKAIANEFGRPVAKLLYADNPGLKEWAMAKLKRVPKKGLTVGKPSGYQFLGNPKNKFMDAGYMAVRLKVPSAVRDGVDRAIKK